MHITVEEALQIYPLSRARIVAGAEGLLRVIKSVSTMDSPDDADWIKSGEMIFTTAFAIKDNPDDFTKLLTKLHKGNAAGLGIKLGRYWNEIPNVVIQKANKLKFPLIELPYEFTFADQMNALIEREIEKTTRKLSDALTIQKNLIRFALQPGDSEFYFDRIAEIITYPIAVISAKGRLLYNSSCYTESELLFSWPWNPRYNKYRSKHGWICSVPLVQENEYNGFLLIMPPSVDQKEEALFHQAAEILVFHMEKFQDDIQTIDSYNFSLAILRYIKGKLTKQQFTDHMMNIDIWSNHYKFICVQTVIDQYNSSIHKDLKKIRRELLFHPILKNKHCYHIQINDYTLLSLITFNNEDQKAHSMNELMQHIQNAYDEVLSIYEYLQLNAYISKPKAHITEIREAKEECEQAELLKEQFFIKSNVILYSNLEFNFIFQFIPIQVLEQYSDNILRPLLSKGAEYATEILKTLDTYIEYEANVTETAKALFIHKNTVLYRIDKISELLELDLKKPSQLFHLQLALLFRRMINDSTKSNT